MLRKKDIETIVSLLEAHADNIRVEMTSPYYDKDVDCPMKQLKKTQKDISDMIDKLEKIKRNGCN